MITATKMSAKTVVIIIIIVVQKLALCGRHVMAEIEVAVAGCSGDRFGSGHQGDGHSHADLR